MDGMFPWGGKAPKRPKVGAGRAALGRGAKARGGAGRRAARVAGRTSGVGGAEHRRSAAAARRGLSRRRGRARRGNPLGRPIQGAAAELRRFSRIFEQTFLSRGRLRNLMLALAGLWAIWTFGLGDASLPKLLSLGRQNARLTVEIRGLESREATLKHDVEALADPENLDAVERVAHEDHAMLRDGEVLVKFYVEGEEED